MGTIIYGDDGAKPLPGITALESGGFEGVPLSETLKRLPAVLPKGMCTAETKNPPVLIVTPGRFWDVEIRVKLPKSGELGFGGTGIRAGRCGPDA